MLHTSTTFTDSPIYLQPYCMKIFFSGNEVLVSWNVYKNNSNKIISKLSFCSFSGFQILMITTFPLFCHQTVGLKCHGNEGSEPACDFFIYKDDWSYVLESSYNIYLKKNSVRIKCNIGPNHVVNVSLNDVISVIRCICHTK